MPAVSGGSPRFARREATEAAGRPITGAQLIAFGVLGACFGATSTRFQSALGWIASSWMTSTAAGVHAKALPPSAMGLLQHGALILTMAAVFFLISTAVYFALGRD